MQTDRNNQELLSALADGELEGQELAQALALCENDGAFASWNTYHLIGDALRSPALARPADSQRMLERLRAEIAQPLAVQPLQEVAAPIAVAQQPAAANDALWRWKMVAGMASFAAVAAIGWNSFSTIQTDTAAGPQLAQVAPAVQPVQTEVARADGQVMIRDPRLDELLAAHKQFGGASALQMPAGFLRNATFESPQR